MILSYDYFIILIFYYFRDKRQCGVRSKNHINQRKYKIINIKKIKFQYQIISISKKEKKISKISEIYK